VKKVLKFGQKLSLDSTVVSITEQVKSWDFGFLGMSSSHWCGKFGTEAGLSARSIKWSESHNAASFEGASGVISWHPHTTF